MPIDTLRYLNALVGFCVNDPTWPHPLHDLGYNALFTEMEITVSFRRRSRTVTADLILSSSRENHAACIELKSSSVDTDQLERYLAISPNDLFDQGLVVTGCHRDSLSHDVVYMTETERTSDVEVVVQGKAPVVGGDEQRFSLASGQFSSSTLSNIFSSGIDVSTSPWPASYIQFTSEPQYKIQLLQSMLVALSRVILRGEAFTLEELTRSSVPHWTMIGTQEKAAFRNSVRRMLNTASQTELAEFIVIGGNGTWNCPRGRIGAPQTIKRLQRLVNEHFGRIKSDQPFNPPRKDQLPLTGLDELS